MFPLTLSKLARSIAATVAGIHDFVPSAAIVNYYDLEKRCTMGGHLDDREKDFTKPVVSSVLSFVNQSATVAFNDKFSFKFTFR